MTREKKVLLNYKGNYFDDVFVSFLKTKKNLQVKNSIPNVSLSLLSLLREEEEEVEGAEWCWCVPK